MFFFFYTCFSEKIKLKWPKFPLCPPPPPPILRKKSPPMNYGNEMEIQASCRYSGKKCCAPPNQKAPIRLWGGGGGSSTLNKFETKIIFAKMIPFPFDVGWLLVFYIPF